ncbi:hypothetical protein [Sessilibacter corallicola]
MLGVLIGLFKSLFIVAKRMQIHGDKHDRNAYSGSLRVYLYLLNPTTGA